MITDVTNYYNINNIFFEEAFSFTDFDNLEYTAEEVNNFIDSFSNNFKSSAIFNESYYYNYLNEAAIKNSSSDLRKLGIQNSDIKIKKAGQDIVNTIKKDGITKESRKKIHNIISDLFQDLADQLSYDKRYDKNGQLQKIPTDKLKRSIFLLLWVIIINTLANIVLSLLFSGIPIVVTTITCVIVAPLVEESAKIISVKGHFDKEFFIVFNAYEFSSYVISGSASVAMFRSLGFKDIGFLNVIRGRLAAVGMHGVNTVIHKIFDSDKFKEKFKLTDKDAKDKATLLSFIIGVIIHGTWNTAAIHSEGFKTFIFGAHLPTEDEVKHALAKKGLDLASNFINK